MNLIDLSQTIEPGMSLFSESAPQPEIREWLTHEASAQTGWYDDCTVAMTEMTFVTSMGTYMDSPYHFNPDGATIEALSLDHTVLPGVVIDCTRFGEYDGITPDVLDGVDVAGKAVLFRTDWSRFWGQDQYTRFPFLTGETAQALVEEGAKLAGVDFLVIDDIRDPKRPVHVTLLHNKVLIVENLTNLAALPTDGFTFHAAPVKVKGAAAFPVRAYGVTS